jgi:hypothetical protein
MGFDFPLISQPFVIAFHWVTPFLITRVPCKSPPNRTAAERLR